MTITDVINENIIRFLVQTYTLLSLPFYSIAQKPWQNVNRSNRLPSFLQFQRGDGYLSCRNNKKRSDLHQAIRNENVDTIEKLIEFAVDRYGEKRMLGTRQLLGEENELQSNGTMFTKYALGNYCWKTYNEVYTEVRSFGRGLRSLGFNNMMNVAIFSETRAEWMIAAFGCMKQSLPIVTLYANLNDEGFVHGLVETETSCIITSYDLLPRVMNIIPQLGGVKTIIVFEHQIKSFDKISPGGNTQLIGYKEVVHLGASFDTEDCLPNPEDTAIIMYTSGSTGKPKGVVLSHKNILSSLFGYLDEFRFSSDEVVLAYLPLAHVLELIVETIIVLCGASIGYSSPLTLTDRSSKVKLGYKGDATVLRPSALTSVPLINERLYKSIKENIESRPQLIRSVFKFLIDYKIYWTNLGYSTPIFDNLILKPKLASILGGRIKRIFGGGAPLAEETHAFIRAVFCCPIYQGYGLTETAASACVMAESDRSTGSVGIPTTCSEIRLVSWEAGGYMLTDTPHPRGEIHIGGDIVAQGYYHQAELTAQEFYEEDGKRWFRTGDIGEISLSTGRIWITDRKKDLIKNQYGEYIALNKVESILKTCKLIDNICVYADSLQFFTVALVSPNVEQLKLVAERENIVQQNWNELCNNRVLEDAIRQEIFQHPSVQNGHLRKFEIPHKLKIVPDLWTPESNLVTASFKLKRKNIIDKYQILIDQMYHV